MKIYSDKITLEDNDLRVCKECEWWPGAMQTRDKAENWVKE